jgi:dihydroxy-acid dehydratase
MREMLHVTRRSSARASPTRSPLVTDGASRRDPRLHGRPRHAEAFHGGPLAALEEGDIVVLDVEARELRVELSDDELGAGLDAWSPPAPRYETGVLAKYARLVSSASEGAVTRA